MKLAPRFSFDALESYLARTCPPDSNVQFVNTDTRPRLMTDAAIAELIGVTRETVLRRRARGDLMMHQAEDAADALDVSPCEIWHEWWDALNDYYDRRGERQRQRKRERRAAA